jgi:hypothetical protein
MKRLLGIALVSLLLVGATGLARQKAPVIAKGTQIGVVNLLAPELMHYHAAKDPQGSFSKIQSVHWNIDEMLNESLRGMAAEQGLLLVPLAPTDSLVRSRESCFVDASLIKGLPKKCVADLVALASSAGVSYLIVMGPGLNNADHADSAHLDGMSSMLRGWGFLTRERSDPKDRPTLFSEIELLLIGVTPQGATLRARQWGGDYAVQWQSYTTPADPKAIAPEQLDELRPLYAALLARQAKDLVDQVHIDP